MGTPTSTPPRGGSAGTFDVLVVGGGLIGLVVAWRAAQRGLTVAVVDPEPGGGAARVAAGMLAAVTETAVRRAGAAGPQPRLGPPLPVVRRPSWPRPPAWTLGYRRLRHPGGRPGRRRPRRAARTARLPAVARAGVGVAVRPGVPPPGADARPRGARRPAGGRRPPDRPAPAGRRAAARRASGPGCGCTGTRVERVRVRRRPGGRRGARATATVLSAGQVVLAAGSRSGRLAGLPAGGAAAGAAGQGPDPAAADAGRRPRALPVPDGARGGARQPRLPGAARRTASWWSARPARSCGWDTTVTAGGVYELLRDAHELVPGITELPLTETLAGPAPRHARTTRRCSGRPRCRACCVATGHHRNGVLLTPVTGDVMAHVLTAGELPRARPGASRPPGSRRHPHSRRRPV